MRPKTLLEALNKLTQSINEAVVFNRRNLVDHTTFTNSNMPINGKHNHLAIGDDQISCMLNKSKYPFYVYKGIKDIEEARDEIQERAISLAKATPSLKAARIGNKVFAFKGIPYKDGTICDYVFQKSTILTDQRIRSAIKSDKIYKDFINTYGTEFFDVVVVLRGDSSQNQDDIVKTIFPTDWNSLSALQEKQANTDTDNNDVRSLLPKNFADDLKLMIFDLDSVSPIIIPVTKIKISRKLRGRDAQGNPVYDYPIKLEGKLYYDGEEIDIKPGNDTNVQGNTVRNRTAGTNQEMKEAKENFRREAINTYLQLLHRVRGNKNISKISKQEYQKVWLESYWVNDRTAAIRKMEDSQNFIIDYYMKLKEIGQEVTWILRSNGEYGIIERLIRNLPAPAHHVWDDPIIAGAGGMIGGGKGYTLL